MPTATKKWSTIKSKKNSLNLLEGEATSTLYEDGFDDVYLVKLALF